MADDLDLGQRRQPIEDETALLVAVIADVGEGKRERLFASPPPRAVQPMTKIWNPSGTA
jgi:hypothetical protein